jgi:hypothetical protein
MKSVRPKSPEDNADEPPWSIGGRNPHASFHGQKRSDATDASSTDPQAGLYKKGAGEEPKLYFTRHGLMENRHRLLADSA